MLSKRILSEQIKNSIIDVLLASPLNVDFIPDDIEREMYLSIFNILVSEDLFDESDDTCFIL